MAMAYSRTNVIGLGAIVAGAVLLLLLRMWTSPITRTVMGRDSISVIAFMGIPLFLGLVALGIGLLLYGVPVGERS